MMRRGCVLLLLLLLCLSACDSARDTSGEDTVLYRQTSLLYVGRTSLSDSGVSLSASDLAAAQDLTDTYIMIAQSRKVLDAVAQQSQCGYTYEELKTKVSLSRTGETRLLTLVVTDTDPDRVQRITEAFVQVFPETVNGIFDDTRVVDVTVGDVTCC